MKKKIAFLATGGTIACVKTPEGLRPAFTQEEMLELLPELSEIAEIEGRMIMNIDSSNMQPEDWIIIAKEVEKALKNCDGVVISHGTDTMAYTSSALTYILTFLKKPVVLTGAQVPIGEEGSDGKKNLKDAFLTATAGEPGVFVVFDGKIIFGDRAEKLKSKSFDAFYSVNSPFAGEVVDGKVTFAKEVLKAERDRIQNIWQKIAIKEGYTKREIQGDPCIVYDKINAKVMLFKLYPGFEPDMLLYPKGKGYKAVLIESFGAGGVTFREPRNLIPAIKELIDSGIKVAVTTQVVYEGVDLSLYEVGRKALEVGAISCDKDTREAALIKLMLSLYD